jgi:hypothetical protein
VGGGGRQAADAVVDHVRRLFDRELRLRRVVQGAAKRRVMRSAK